MIDYEVIVERIEMFNFVELYIEKDIFKSVWYLIVLFGSIFISKWLVLYFRNMV